MKIFSYRTSITIILIVVISIISSVAFYIFNQTLSEKIRDTSEANIKQVLGILKDQYNFTIMQHDGKIIRTFLKDMKRNKQVLKTYLINSEEKIVYPENFKAPVSYTPLIHELYEQPDEISLRSFHSKCHPYSRGFIRLSNSVSCQKCHTKEIKNLGIIVIDFAIKETEQNIKYTRKFSIGFSILMVLVIVACVVFMHFYFVKKSVTQFQSVISIINQGNLDKRLSTQELKELEGLGESFNKMMDSFQNAQKELHSYHQKELLNKHKLATIGEMTSRLAHEIRNPLMGIANAVEIIVNETTEESNKPILEEIQRQAKRVNDAISNLLKYSRDKELNMVQGNINEIINSLVFFLRNQTHRKEIEFITDLQKDIPVFLFDVELIENVLLNLSLNSIKAIHENGSISFKTNIDKNSNSVTISVIDTGTGIDEKIINDVFKPYFTTHTEGTGLGLAIAKDMIEKHKGKIWVENNPDKGCSFFILLPTLLT